MDTNSAFWRDLEAEFRALPDPAGRLIAMLSDGQWHVYDGPNDERERERLQELFRSMARRAAIAAGVPTRANALDGWLNLLREESPHFRVRHGTTKRMALKSTRWVGTFRALLWLPQNTVWSVQRAPSSWSRRQQTTAHQLDFGGIDTRSATGFMIMPASLLRTQKPSWSIGRATFGRGITTCLRTMRACKWQGLTGTKN